MISEILNHASDNTHYRRVDQVGASLISNESLLHTFVLSFQDIDTIPEILNLEKVCSEESPVYSLDYRRWPGGGLLRVESARKNRSIGINGYFKLATAAKETYNTIFAAFPRVEPPANIIPLSFWSWSEQHGPRQATRRITVPSWEEIHGNYSAEVTTNLYSLMSIEPSVDLSGRLILWRGPAGTGKTWSLRALCREWRSWCSAHYVIDPDAFFSKAEYMVGVLTQITSDDRAELPSAAEGRGIMGVSTSDGFPDQPRWNLLILEDAGELVAMDSKFRTGQALSKLLNLSDGLLGQGINLIVLITTNEEYKDLHPAIARQGRCLSNIEFNSLSEVEAKTWLKNHGCDSHPPHSKRTLADLYALLTENKTIQNTAEPKLAGFLNGA